MKEALSLLTFSLGALCFVLFVTVFKPNAIDAVRGDEQARVLQHGTFASARFAARSWPDRQ